MRRALSFIAKAAISALLLYLALDWANVGTVSDRLSRVHFGWLALEVLVLTAQVLLVAMRWRQIVLQCDKVFPLSRSFRYSMIATFFNQTLPSSVGGDAARIWLLARHGAGWSIATYSVIVDRVLGVITLAVFVIVCLPWSYELVRNPVGRAALALIGFGSIVAGLIFIAMGWRRLRFLQRWRITRHLAAAASVAGKLVSSPRAGSRVAGLSVAIHLFTVLAAWCAAKAVAAPFDFSHSLFLVPPVLLAAVIPVSIAGWGVRESAMVMAFAYAGLSQSDGLLVSLLYGAGYFIVGVIGGAVWILGADHVKFDPLPKRKSPHAR